jgi:hypothetical protein
MTKICLNDYLKMRGFEKYAQKFEVWLFIHDIHYDFPCVSPALYSVM